MTCVRIWHSIGRSCERCSVAGILVLTRALLHPDHVTQRSCASAVSLLFSALDRPMEPQMSIQVVNICDLFFYEHCSLLCTKVCEACCLTVAAFADRSPAAAAAVPRALQLAESLVRTGVACAAELWSALTAVGIPSGAITRPSAFCLHDDAYAACQRSVPRSWIEAKEVFLVPDRRLRCRLFEK